MDVSEANSFTFSKDLKFESGYKFPSQKKNANGFQINLANEFYFREKNICIKFVNMVGNNKSSVRERYVIYRQLFSALCRERFRSQISFSGDRFIRLSLSIYSWCPMESGSITGHLYHCISYFYRSISSQVI